MTSEERERVVANLEQAVRMIESYAKVILTEDARKIAQGMIEFTGLLNLIFPMIIQDYELVEFSDRQEEISVWINLLSQITETLAGKDTLAKTDLLYHVLRPDVLEHIQVLKENA